MTSRNYPNISPTRMQRDAARMRKELERQRQTQDKLDLIARARLEVELWQNQLDVLLSMHKDCAPAIDWHAHACALQPFEGLALASAERRAFRERCVAASALTIASAPALRADGLGHSDRRAFSATYDSWRQLRDVATRVLKGDPDAYLEVLTVHSSLNELTQLGATVRFVVHSQRELEATVTCNDSSIIPERSKSLTATGKLTEKAIPRARVHELYQDHVCSSLLRVARECFAVLPIDLLLLNGLASLDDSGAGAHAAQPIYSVIIQRNQLTHVAFDSADPSTVLEGFLHVGDFKATRRSGAFAAVTPLRLTDATPDNGRVPFSVLVQRMTELRRSLSSLVQ